MVPALLAAALAASVCTPAPERPLITGVGPIAVTVSDLDRSIEFFTRTLEFTLESRDERQDEQTERTLGIFGARVQTATLRLGQERLQLIDFLTPDGRPIPADSRSNDRWFQHIAIVVSDMDLAFARLRGAGVTFASTGPQRLPDWNPDAGGIEAFYFKDPDRHVLEIIHFPPGKGDPKWRAAAIAADGTPDLSGAARRTPAPGSPAPVFLGIDHTAIVTADTDRDVAFYTGVLGLHVAGASDNFGIEQERLNNVFGAHLRITALRATSGPGIELLEYLTPTTGRDLPRDSRADDLWHWHVTLTTPGIADAERALAGARAPRVSAAAAAPDRPLEMFIVRDPDGHALLLAPDAKCRPHVKRAD